jgi:hypothetical protein
MRRSLLGGIGQSIRRQWPLIGIISLLGYKKSLDPLNPAERIKGEMRAEKLKCEEFEMAAVALKNAFDFDAGF